MDTNWILDRFKELKATECVVYKNTPYRYSDLLQNISRWKNAITHLGIQEGECIVIPGEVTPQSVGLFWALILNQNIVAPLSKESHDQKEKFFSLAQVNGSFEFGEADLWSYDVFSPPMKSRHPLLCYLQVNREAGIIIPTSNDSGRQKFAVHQASLLFERNRIVQPNEARNLVFSKLDHIEGLTSCTSMMLSGGTIILSEEHAAESVCQTIEQYKVQHLPIDLNLLNGLVNSKAYDGYDLSTLEVITHTGAPLTENNLEEIHRIFPGVEFQQLYGSAELGGFSTLSESEHTYRFKVGTNHSVMKVVDNILWMRTPSLMLGYLSAPSPFDSEGWFNTGDWVAVDDDTVCILGGEKNGQYRANPM